MNLTNLIDSLATHLSPAMRWAGSVARRMRNFDMRLPRIIATSPDRALLATWCGLADDWNPVRYAE
jgi:hypothetical protein